MKNLVLFSSFLILASCSSTIERRIEVFNASEVSQGAILDLARNSYLRGCADNGTGYGETSFVRCVEKAKHHEAEIRDILEKDIIYP